MGWKAHARCGARAALVLGCWTLLAAGCAGPDTMNTTAAQAALDALQGVRQQFAPDSHLARFDVKARQDGSAIILSGEVDNPAARQAPLDAVGAAGLCASDRITVLPAKKKFFLLLCRNDSIQTSLRGVARERGESSQNRPN